MVLVTESRTREVRGGESPRTFAELYQELAPEVRRFLIGLRLPLPRQDHEDALQETFLRLYRGWSRYDGSRPLVAYALGIARHVAIDLCRKAPPVAVPLDPERDKGASSTSDRVDAAERGRLVDAALQALDPELRSVLTLRHVNGLKMQDLADSLQCSLPTARARLREAGHRFAIELRRLGLVPGEVI